jgi:hypothetical protein
MIDPVPAVHAWPTNGHLIEGVAKLGYLDGDVLDATYGRGRFWSRWRPEKLTCNDLNTLEVVDNSCSFRHDFRCFPADWAGWFDAVVLDPPYKLNGTPALGDFDNAYGLDAGYVPWAARHAMINGGIAECLRVLRLGGYLLLKCKDQVCSGHVRWQTTEFTFTAARGGAELVDRFDMVTKPQKQPDRSGKSIEQQHARRNASTLLVFVKKVNRA